MTTQQPRVLITGAAGFIGRKVCAALAEALPDGRVVGTDIRTPATGCNRPNVRFELADIRSDRILKLLQEERITSIVHLASIVTPPPGMSRDVMHEIDVTGTQRVLDAALRAGVEHFIVTTSGAAYGYHADNPVPLHETDALRGNTTFAYSDHKRQVEELLARYREEHPQLKQLVFRPGTVLGEDFNNQITALFEKSVMLGIRGTESPFVIIWDDDVAACIVKGVLEGRGGIYNLAGDGTISMREMAAALGKRYLALPTALVQSVLAVLHPLRLSQYGPEQVDFLRYRPVLANDALKAQFGYTPSLSSRDCFLRYTRHKGLLKHDPLQESTA